MSRVAPNIDEGGLVTCHSANSDGVSGGSDPAQIKTPHETANESRQATAGVKGIPKYRRPRTGEKRKLNKALTIDRLSQDIKDVIVKARDCGETWARITKMASAASGQCLSLKAIHRWYDLRVAQKSDGNAMREIIRLLKSILAAVQK